MKRVLSSNDAKTFFGTSINTIEDGVGLLWINVKTNEVQFNFNGVLLMRFDGIYADQYYRIDNPIFPTDFSALLAQIQTVKNIHRCNEHYVREVDNQTYHFNLKLDKVENHILQVYILCYEKLLETEQNITRFGDVVGSGLSLFAGSTWWHDYDEEDSEYFYSSDVGVQILGIPVTPNKMYSIAEFQVVRDKARIVSDQYELSIEKEAQGFEALRNNVTDFFAGRTPVVTSDDKIVWVEAYGKCIIRYPDGSPRFVIALDIYLTDIYEEKTQLELITKLIDFGLINSDVGIWYYQRHFLEGKYYFTKSYQHLMSTQSIYKDETISDILDEQIELMIKDGRGYEQYIENFRTMHNSIFYEGVDKYHVIIPNFRNDDNLVWIEIRGTVIERDDDGNVMLFVGANVDVTETHMRNRELEELRMTNERLSLAENLAVQARGLLVWYHEFPKGGLSGQIYGNKMFVRRLGITRDANGYIPLTDLQRTMVRDDSESKLMFNNLRNHFIRVYRNQEKAFRNVVVKHRNVQTGEIIYFEHSCQISEYYEDGSIKLLGGILLDVTESTLNQKKIRYLADYDVLSDLYNRNYFERYIESSLPDTYSILLFDLDGLKLINDAFGHLEGDHIIKQLAMFLKEIFHDALFIARIGGDEFAIVTEDVDFDLVTAKANELEAVIETFNRTSRYQLNVSKGGKQVINNDLSFERAFIQAENIMYRRKLNNRSSRKFKVLESLMETLEAKTEETKEHSQRVSELAVKTMRGLHMTRSSEIEDIELIAKVHDIGKITIPDGILNKPSPLTEAEFELVKKHSEAGYKIIRNITNSDDVCNGVLYHHERYDGTGYPQGLKGEDIPIFARVISVVDAFDAMTSNRVYHVKKTIEEGIQEVIACAGSQFDPHVVKVFLKSCFDYDWDGK